jgi:hypothetical protein
VHHDEFRHRIDRKTAPESAVRAIEFDLQSPCATFSPRAVSESVDTDSRVFETEVAPRRRFLTVGGKLFLGVAFLRRHVPAAPASAEKFSCRSSQRSQN